MKPAVFTIPAGTPFIHALAEGILNQCHGDGASLADVTVLLPTRRACRGLAEAFIQQTGSKPLILPRMMPLGDVDEDELSFAEWQGDGNAPTETFDLPPAIPAMQRQLLLTRLIGADKSRDVSADQAARLAIELARLLDQVHTERLDFDDLRTLVPESYAVHWQVILDFLAILTERWPDIIGEMGCLDPADRRNRVLEAQARAWQKNPPTGAVIAAGSTGSIPATADLLGVIASLPRGCVILPGLDCEASDEIWAELEASHPQFGMARLLEHVGANRKDVALWGGEESAGSKPERSRLINRALLPAAVTHTWRHQAPPTDSDLDGVTRIDCPGAQEEAAVIALIMRQTLEFPDQTAALVTPDRGLARRVVAEMKRWGVTVDDSAGQPMAETPPGVILRLTARLAVEGLAPVPLLSCLKHPLAALGQNPGACRRAVRMLEQSVLRGPRPGPGIDGLRAATAENEAELRDLVNAVEDALAPFIALLNQGDAPFKALLEAHLFAAESIAATDKENGARRLWKGEAGEAAALFASDVAESAGILETIPCINYPALLDTLMAARMVRPRFGVHARLSIWGLLEARLQTADTLILGGLNEGVWPPDVAANPWMSRPMTGDFGLPLPERRIGQTAHDFTQAFAAPEVVLTRAIRSGGTPTVPSRWLLRIENMLRGTGLEAAMRLGEPVWLHWQALLNTPGRFLDVLPPAPKPPVSARPRSLSVTQVETWMRDPYAIYARHILGLRAIDPIDADPGSADYGTVIHDTLDAFLKRYPDDLPEDAYAALITIGENTFGGLLARPGVWAFWWPRFERIARWFAQFEAERRAHVQSITSEVRGRVDLKGPAGPFTLTAKADRIDILADGTLAIIDYKTGALPSSREVAAGFAPQLPLEGIIAQSGGFDGIHGAPVSALQYWRLRGGDPAAELRSAGDEPSALISTAERGLTELIATFDSEQTPYPAQPRFEAAPRFSDFEHLARIKEWASAGGDGSE